MGDHFVVMVDKLLAESNVEAVIDSNNSLRSVSKRMTTGFSLDRMDTNVGSSPRELAECRICHDEDEDSNMDIPCSCRGSLKYAHHKCVQRWCDEKGDTTCEICLQKFKPGYTAPPPLFHIGGIPMNFRGDWETPRNDPPQLTSMVSTDENFDEYLPTSRSLICCRVVAMIFVVLLVLRHSLPFILYDGDEYSLSIFMLLMLRVIGILLPIYVMVRALTAMQRRRHQQEYGVFPLASSDEENDLRGHHHRSRLVQLP